jgi:hypothetical protein
VVLTDHQLGASFQPAGQLHFYSQCGGGDLRPLGWLCFLSILMSSASHTPASRPWALPALLQEPFCCAAFLTSLASLATKGPRLLAKFQVSHRPLPKRPPTLPGHPSEAAPPTDHLLRSLSVAALCGVTRLLSMAVTFSLGALGNVGFLRIILRIHAGWFVNSSASTGNEAVL